MTFWRRCDVTTLPRRHVPTRFLINQCQIITFLILKSDNIENSRIDLKGIILQVHSNQIKVTFIIILPSNLVHLWFFPVSHRNWRKMWVDYLGGQRVGLPPLKLLGGPPAQPSSYAYVWRGKYRRGRGIPWTCYTVVVLLRCNIRELYSLSPPPTLLASRRR